MRPTAIARPTTLVVPAEYKAATNVTSGFLTGDLGGKSLKGLFLAPENARYIGDQLVSLLTHPRYIADKIDGRVAGESVADIGHPRDATSMPANAFAQMDADALRVRAEEIAAAFAAHANEIRALAPGLIRAHDSAINRVYREDTTLPNPLLALHTQNLALLIQASTNLLATPEQLVPELARYNPDTGSIAGTARASPDDNQYDYDTTSYNDGTWHPEHLFTNSVRNENNPYWVPMEVNLNSRSGNRERAPGHRFNSPAYGVDALVSERAGEALSSSQFPRWQQSQPGRNGQTRTPQGLREGGEGDRRTQWSRGSQMADLRSKSYY